MNKSEAPKPPEGKVIKEGKITIKFPTPKQVYVYFLLSVFTLFLLSILTIPFNICIIMSIINSAIFLYIVFSWDTNSWSLKK